MMEQEISLRFLSKEKLNASAILSLEGVETPTLAGNYLWIYYLEYDLPIVSQILNEKSELIQKLFKLSISSSIWVCCYSSDLQLGFNFPPEFISAVGKTGLKIDISIYAGQV